MNVLDQEEARLKKRLSAGKITKAEFNAGVKAINQERLNAVGSAAYAESLEHRPWVGTLIVGVVLGFALAAVAAWLAGWL